MILQPSAKQLPPNQTPTKEPRPKQTNINNQKVISKPRTLRKQIKKNPGVTYLTRNATPESIGKIKNIRGTGHGKSLIIIGNGPSINEIDLSDLKNLSNVDLLSINTPHQAVWPTKYWAFFDRSQLNRHKKLWESYGGIMFNSTSIKEQKPTSMQFKHHSGLGFSRDLTKGLYIGRSSVYASIQIAVWMEFDKIYIIGCDMNPDGIAGQLHFYGVNPDVQPELRSKRFASEANSYAYAGDHLEESIRKKIYFCSDYNTWPFVDKFSRISHKNLIDHLRNI